MQDLEPGNILPFPKLPQLDTLRPVGSVPVVIFTTISKMCMNTALWTLAACVTMVIATRKHITKGKLLKDV